MVETYAQRVVRSFESFVDYGSKMPRFYSIFLKLYLGYAPVSIAIHHVRGSRDMIAHQRACFTTTFPISHNLSRLYSSFYRMLFWFTLVNACNRFPFKKWRENIVINCSTLINWIITIMALIFIDFTLTFYLMLRDPPNLSSSCGWRTNIHFSLVDQK